MAENANNAVEITEAPPSGEAEKQIKKPIKMPREPRPAAPRSITPAQEQGKKKKKGGKLKIILIIVFVVLIAGFVFEEIYYNYLGTRDVFIEAVGKLDPEQANWEARLQEREAELDQREADLATRERTATSRETQNERLRAELDMRQETLNEQEQWLAPLYKRQMTEQERLDMQSVSQSYSMMAPAAAADILLELENVDDVAAILYFMNERNSGAILAAMAPEYAAIITEILLYK